MSADAGWFADPYGAAALRWWDGTAWTAHVHDGIARDDAPVDVPDPVVAEPAVSEPAAPRSRRRRLPWRAVVLTVLGAVALGSAVAVGRTDIGLPVAAAVAAGGCARRARFAAAAFTALAVSATVVAFLTWQGDPLALRYLAGDGRADRGALALALTGLATGLATAVTCPERGRAAAWAALGAIAGLLVTLAVLLPFPVDTSVVPAAFAVGACGLVCLGLSSAGARLFGSEERVTAYEVASMNDPVLPL